MEESETSTSTAEQPSLPDFYTNPNAVLGDASATWRYGKPPDYSKTRKVFAETKSKHHPAGSLPQLVENLVKNWEIEASFKINLAEWRTINHERYTFSLNGGSPQTGDHMLKVGTYNAIIAPNEYYSPENSDFASSHKTFKRMMPTFAWEVLEVYSGPPKVAFRWRHWGDMKSDYVGFNNVGEKITAKAHGRTIDIQGVTVADLDDQMKIVHLETWFDAMDMFRQIAPHGIVNKQPSNAKCPDGSVEEIQSAKDTTSSRDEAYSLTQVNITTHNNGLATNGDVSQAGVISPKNYPVLADVDSASPIGPEADICPAGLGEEITHVSVYEPVGDSMDRVENKDHTTAEFLTGSISDQTSGSYESRSGDIPVQSEGTTTEILTGIEKTKGASGQASGIAQREAYGIQEDVRLGVGEAVAASGASEETRLAHEEMSNITPAECPFLMNKS